MNAPVTPGPARPRPISFPTRRCGCGSSAGRCCGSTKWRGGRRLRRRTGCGGISCGPNPSRTAAPLKRRSISPAPPAPALRAPSTRSERGEGWGEGWGEGELPRAPNGCPAPRQRKNGVSDAINHKPDGANHKPVVTNGTPVVTDIVGFIPCFAGFLTFGPPVAESQWSFLALFESLCWSGSVRIAVSCQRLGLRVAVLQNPSPLPLVEGVMKSASRMSRVPRVGESRPEGCPFQAGEPIVINLVRFIVYLVGFMASGTPVIRSKGSVMAFCGGGAGPARGLIQCRCDRPQRYRRLPSLLCRKASSLLPVVDREQQ